MERVVSQARASSTAVNPAGMAAVVTIVVMMAAVGLVPAAALAEGAAETLRRLAGARKVPEAVGKAAKIAAQEVTYASNEEGAKAVHGLSDLHGQVAVGGWGVLVAGVPPCMAGVVVVARACNSALLAGARALLYKQCLPTPGG